MEEMCDAILKEYVNKVCEGEKSWGKKNSTI